MILSIKMRRPRLILTFINKLYLLKIFAWPSFVPQMKKAFRRYLFPLCLLLLGGFINLYADAQDGIDEESACYLEAGQNLEHIDSIGSLQYNPEKKYCTETEVEEQEEREEEAASHDLNLEFGSYLTAFFYASQSGQFIRKPDTDLGNLSPNPISTPLKRYIRFQVFRI